MREGRGWLRLLAVAAGTVVCLALASTTAQAEDAVTAGMSVGFTLNGDQFVVGAHLERSGQRLIWGGQVLVGFGDAFTTVRASGRVGYEIGGEHAGARPTAAFSSLLYLPVGRLASYCGRSSLQCWGFEVGPELGGSVRWRQHRVEAMGGLYGLPALTLLAGTSR